MAAWATAMGACLGFLYQATGNLVVPVLAHAIYDGVAITYAKRLPASRYTVTGIHGQDEHGKHEDTNS
jgi:membrane protease YdiL (CAAX protease family)